MRATLLLLSAVLLLSACSLEQDQLSSDQLSAVNEIERTCQLANAYNESLATAYMTNAPIETALRQDAEPEDREDMRACKRN